MSSYVETRDTQGEGKIGGCRRRWKEDGVRRRVAGRDGKWKGPRNYLERHCVCRPEGCKHLISHSNSVAQSDPLLLKRHIKRDGPSPFFGQKEQSMGGKGGLVRIFVRSKIRKWSREISKWSVDHLSIFWSKLNLQIVAEYAEFQIEKKGNVSRFEIVFHHVRFNSVSME